ncbi:MAG: ATP synthase F1 subunit delta [Nitrospirota bacterium]
MRRSQEIRRYAKMLLNTTGIDEIPVVLKELGTVDSIISESREFRGVLENPLFTTQEREKVIREVSNKFKLSEKTARFVIFLSGQRMIAGLQDLIQLATALYLERMKRARAVVVTPVDLRDKYEGRLKASLKKLTGRDVDIEYIIDPSLLGGMIVRVGSTMYDSSIKGQLRLLRDDLIKG